MTIKTRRNKRGKKKGGRTSSKNKGQSKIIHQFKGDESRHNNLFCKCQ